MSDNIDARIEQTIAEMTDAEFDSLVARTRPPRLDPADADAAIRAAEQTGNWRQSMHLKNQKLTNLIRTADKNGHQR